MQNHSGRPAGEDAEQIFRRYADTLFRFCFTLAGNQADAEDAVSETMIRYITRAPAFDSEEHRKAWLLRVAANICRDMHRFHLRHTYVSLEDAYDLCADEQQVDILEEVMRLPKKLKTVIYLYYIEGYTSEKIADMLSISAAAADYTSLPSAQQCEQDVGFTPALLQSFNNGFAFKDGSVVSNQEQNEDGQTVNKYASLDFTYQKGDETASLVQDSGSSQEEMGNCVAQKDGVSYYETTKTEKYVSDSYQMTEEDQKEEASGNVEFNVGNSDAIHAGQSDNGVETEQYHGINWTVGGVHYTLYQMNGSLTTAQMLEMAQQITAAADK